jgi:3-oxoacyl-[acyl-carrier-protein] synthase-3
VHTHSLFGNTASTSWALALDYRLRNGTVQPGDKIVVASAAAGFTIVAAAAVWDD